MNTEKFLHYLKIGHGRAVTMLMDAEDKASYRQTVYDMAVTDVRFDRQTDSLRGEYILDLVRCFPDSDEMIAKILEHYGNASADDDNIGYYITNLSEMLGEVSGVEGVIFKLYETVYEWYLNGRGTERDPASENYWEYIIYESAVYHLITADSGFGEKIIRDMVRLNDIKMLTSDMIQSAMRDLEEKLGQAGFAKFLDRMKKELPATADLYGIYLKSSEHITNFNNPYDHETKKEYDINSVDDLLAYYKKQNRQLSISHSYWKKITEADVKRIADIILGYEESEVRRLVAFQFTRLWADKEYAGLIPPFPYDVSMISEIVKNADVTIESKDYATYVSISKIAGSLKSEENRAFALMNLKKKFADEYDSEKGNILRSFIMDSIVANYKKEDAEVLFDVAKNISDPYILDSFSYDLVNEMFPSLDCVNETEAKLLYYLYENLYCTNCRGKAAEEIVRLGLLTDEIRREMKYDTSINIRKMDLQ